MVQADFKAMEHSGWSEWPAVYEDYTGPLCRQAVAALLRDGEVVGGQSVLDVCCGTGAAAAEAARLGASVTAIDFSNETVAVARARCTGGGGWGGEGVVCWGGRGEAQPPEALAFEDASFDRVVCSFGIIQGRPLRAAV
jgi:ubiquinone/menaquinone biosynthesis C-methylase UbiE